MESGPGRVEFRTYSAITATSHAHPASAVQRMDDTLELLVSLDT